MGIKRGAKGIKRHRPVNGLRHLGYKTAAGQSRRFVAYMLQQDIPVTAPKEPSSGEDV